MSDVPGGSETRTFPAYDCHFMGRKKDDVHREVKELVYDILRTRELSRSEEKVFREVANEAFDIMIAAHKADDTQRRIQEQDQHKKAGRDWLGIAINIISMLTAVTAVVYAISKSGGGTP